MIGALSDGRPKSAVVFRLVDDSSIVGPMQSVSSEATSICSDGTEQHEILGHIISLSCSLTAILC
jgi:hypothetical protein